MQSENVPHPSRMSNAKLIAVIGATGGQGGGLARAILDDPEQRFRLRAITRNPDSEAARELARRGAEVVAANTDDRASLERAFSGAHGAFCVTNFWEHVSPERETAQGANMAFAARSAGVAHAIWSTLEDVRRWVPLSDERLPTLMKKYKVPHTDAKGEADAAFREAGVPTTFLLTSFYWENFLQPGRALRRDARGLSVQLPLGEQVLPGIALEDIGRSALGVFARGDALVGKTVGVAGEHTSGHAMAAALTRSLGEPVRYDAVPDAVYRRETRPFWADLEAKTGFPGGEDLASSFAFSAMFNDEFRRARDVEVTRGLNPALQSLDLWLARHRDAFRAKGISAGA
ncbi:NmrA/HSCARG family protein [Pendulispora brunnea]|uniref:NmrA/HSCARG family protein n=1 Tax=Pendulispora brunnea TaxID=2905690 RepID=A0ABZ2JXP7_9BACT